MKSSTRTCLAVLALLVATPTFAQTKDHTDVIAAAKAAAIAAGVDVDSSECARFEVTKRAALLLAGEGAGLLFKNSGNNCAERSVDIIAYPSGRIFDILGAGGDGPNTAHWIELTPVTPDRWRAPFDVVTPTPAPAPPATVEDHDAMLHRIEASLEQLRADVAALQAQGDALAVEEHTEAQQTRAEIKAFRDAAGSALKKLLEYVPTI